MVGRGEKPDFVNHARKAKELKLDSSAKSRTKVEPSRSIGASGETKNAYPIARTVCITFVKQRFQKSIAPTILHQELIAACQPC